MNPKHNMCPGRIRPKSNYLEASSRPHMLIESDTCPLSILHELVHIHVGHRKGLGGWEGVSVQNRWYPSNHSQPQTSKHWMYNV